MLASCALLDPLLSRPLSESWANTVIQTHKLLSSCDCVDTNELRTLMVVTGKVLMWFCLGNVHLGEMSQSYPPPRA